ncbi:MAG: hypothetical protein LUD17_16755 [Bacteroidales bacterium]|nr:hypothetical protein [Bacteroidales bacterium]
MVADLYINHRSFAHNGTDELPEVKAKFEAFSQLIATLGKFKDSNTLYINSAELLQTPITSDMTFMDFMNDVRGVKFNRDVRNRFLSAFKIARRSDANEEQMIEYLQLEDENSSNGVLVMNRQPLWDDNWQVISTVDGWRNFRRKHLAKYPHHRDFNYFVEESKQCFPRIQYSVTIGKGFADVLESHAQAIIEGLGVLNDHLGYEWANDGDDFWVFLPEFARRHGIKDASQQGEPLNFDFEIVGADKSVRNVTLNCEGHLKMYKDDSGNANQHCRIYFAIPERKGDSTIYVGSIRKHI